MAPCPSSGPALSGRGGHVRRWRSGCCTALCGATIWPTCTPSWRASPATLGLAVLFTALSFLALVGYEYSALSMIGSAVPLAPAGVGLVRDPVDRALDRLRLRRRRHAALQFLRRSRPQLGDVAKVRCSSPLTFTLGVATLAGGVRDHRAVRLAATTGMPPWLWRLGAGRRARPGRRLRRLGRLLPPPDAWRGHELRPARAGATLTPDLLRRRRSHGRRRRPLRPAAGLSSGSAISRCWRSSWRRSSPG